MEQRYETYKRNSISGSTSKRDPNRRIRMRYGDYKKTIKVTAIATAIAVSAALAGGNLYVNKVHDNFVIGRMERDFHAEYISPETHRTNDNQHYFYDYSDIARNMEGMEDYDEGIYLLVHDIGKYQADKVLAYTNYGNFDNYLTEHNYKDSKEFDKEMSRKILLEEQIEKNNIEINNMLKDNLPIQEETIYGGNK